MQKQHVVSSEATTASLSSFSSTISLSSSCSDNTSNSPPPSVTSASSFSLPLSSSASSPAVTHSPSAITTSSTQPLVYQEINKRHVAGGKTPHDALLSLPTGPYTVMRTVGGSNIFRLTQHAERMSSSVASLVMKVAEPSPELRDYLGIKSNGSNPSGNVENETEREKEKLRLFDEFLRESRSELAPLLHLCRPEAMKAFIIDHVSHAVRGYNNEKMLRNQDNEASLNQGNLSKCDSKEIGDDRKHDINQEELRIMILIAIRDSDDEPSTTIAPANPNESVANSSERLQANINSTNTTSTNHGSSNTTQPSQCGGNNDNTHNSAYAANDLFDVVVHVSALPPLPTPPIIAQLRTSHRPNASVKDSAWVHASQTLTHFKHSEENEVVMLSKGKFLEGVSSNFFAILRRPIESTNHSSKPLIKEVSDITYTDIEDSKSNYLSNGKNNKNTKNNHNYGDTIQSSDHHPSATDSANVAKAAAAAAAASAAKARALASEVSLSTTSTSSSPLSSSSSTLTPNISPNDSIATTNEGISVTHDHNTVRLESNSNLVNTSYSETSTSPLYLSPPVANPIGTDQADEQLPVTPPPPPPLSSVPTPLSSLASSPTDTHLHTHSLTQPHHHTKPNSSAHQQEYERVLYTARDGILLGTVRQLVLDVCHREGIRVLEEAPSLASLPYWEGCALTSTSRLLLPIDELRFYSTEVQPPPPTPSHHYTATLTYPATDGLALSSLSPLSASPFGTAPTSAPPSTHTTSTADLPAFSFTIGSSPDQTPNPANSSGSSSVSSSVVPGTHTSNSPTTGSTSSTPSTSTTVFNPPGVSSNSEQIYPDPFIPLAALRFDTSENTFVQRLNRLVRNRVAEQSEPFLYNNTTKRKSSHSK